MLRLLIWIMGIATIGAVAAWLASHPGTLTFVWLGWRVDTSVGVLLAAVWVLCLLAVLLTWTMHALVLLPRRLRRARRERSYALGLRAATGSLVALATGDVATARKYASQTQRHLHDTPLALLIAAQTARLEGNDAALHRHMEAMLAHKETRFLAARGLTDRFRRAGDDDAALAYAEQAHALNPRDPLAAEALAGIYARSSEWTKAMRVVKGPDKRRVQGMIMMARAEQSADEGEEAKGRRLAVKAARRLRSSAPAASLAAKMLASHGDRAAALRLIRRAWKRTPNPLLADTFLHLMEDDAPKATLKAARRMAAAQAEHPESQLLIARAGLRARDWQAVREALGLAIAKEESASACRLMATLEREGYGDDIAAERWEKRAEVAHEGSWQCEPCGHSETEWHAHCPRCRAFGKAEWVMTRSAPKTQTVVSVG